MAAPRKVVEVAISEEEAAELARLARSRTEPASRVERAALADDRRDRVAPIGEIEQAVDRAALAHFVVEPAEPDRVRFPERTVAIDANARSEEERNALDAGRRRRELRQHHMDNVLGKFVIAARDPHLAALETVGPVGQRLGARDDVGERGARLRLR